MLVQDEIKKVERIWGHFLQFTENENTTVKLIYIKKGEQTSYQLHHDRSESWYVVSGKVNAFRDLQANFLSTGDHIKIPKKTWHRLIGLEDSIILEICKGLFSEDDILRM